MRCALAAVGFINENTEFNYNKIVSLMKEYKDRADLIIFGEAFLQGFYAVTFEYHHDISIAISAEDEMIKQIANTAIKNKIAVSFGFIEKNGNDIYSSQITIDKNGQIIDLYRRVSEGWKEKTAGVEYKEGSGFHTFSFMGERISTGLCGDLWFDENVRKIAGLKLSLILWPVYTDFNYRVWNETEKFEYAKQAAQFNCSTVLVNSYCLDKEEEQIARGGACYFKDGKIMSEVPAGQEAVLVIEI